MAGNKLTKGETDARVKECHKRRFEDNTPFGVKDWIQYCHKTYGDKSEQQYTAYWMSAGELYEEAWKDKLKKMLKPATDELFSLLASEDEKIRQRAIDQIMKYTGNDIQKVEATVESNINITFGED